MPTKAMKKSAKRRPRKEPNPSPTSTQWGVSPYFARKALFMRLLGGILLVLFMPVILLCMLFVRLTSDGPALYRQTRVGKDGRHFKIYKIRTMYMDSENLSGPVLCQPGDSRITPVGKVLRFLHLDELPQLINVMQGDMCLVGPRPERPEIIVKHKLAERVPGFSDRTKVLPGVTGLAQINLPADQSAECVIPKVQLDLAYISTATAGLDMRILLCTALRMLGVRHGRAVRVLGLARQPESGFGRQHRPMEFTNGHQIASVFGPSQVYPAQAATCAAVGIQDPAVACLNWAGFSESTAAPGDKAEESAGALPRHPR